MIEPSAARIGRLAFALVLAVCAAGGAARLVSGSPGAALAQVSARLDGSRPITYFVARGAPESGFRDGDRELAIWALEAWGRLADPPLQFVPASEETATLRIYWIAPGSGLYGEMRARTMNGRPAADLFVSADTDGLGPDIAELARRDPLFRDTVVHLTCVHELGHAFGLPHTSSFADIMYSFQYGGDFVAYFRRFRDALATRADVARTSAFSRADSTAFAALYAR